MILKDGALHLKTLLYSELVIDLHHVQGRWLVCKNQLWNLSLVIALCDLDALKYNYGLTVGCLAIERALRKNQLTERLLTRDARFLLE